MLLVVVCAVLNAGAGASSTVCWCFATTWLYNERTIGAVLEHELAQSEETVQFSRHSNSNCCLKVKGHHNLYNARTTRSVCVSKVALLKLARYQAAINFCWNQLMKAIGSVYAELIMKPLLVGILIQNERSKPMCCTPEDAQMCRIGTYMQHGLLRASYLEHVVPTELITRTFSLIQGSAHTLTHKTQIYGLRKKHAGGAW